MRPVRRVARRVAAFAAGFALVVAPACGQGPDAAGGAGGAARVRALIDVGRYEQAEAAARPAAATSPEMGALLGHVLRLRGRRSEAERVLRAAARARGAAGVVAAVELGLVLEGRGEVAAARSQYERAIAAYNAGPLGAAELTAVGTAARRLGARDPALFKDALRAYDEAVAADPEALEPRLRAGDLFLEKYNSADARDEFRAVLVRDPANARARLGIARVLDFDGAAGAADSARAALETNPNLVPAHVLLARLALGGGEADGARHEAERALAVDSTSLPALAVLAAAAYLAGDDAAFGAVERRALALDPRCADFYADVAEMALQGYRYAGAVALARRGLALDSTSARARGIVGINELRLGHVAAARASLEAAFRRDPYNVWYKNTLDLLDTFEKYRTVNTEHFELVLRGDEADLLAPYVGALAEEAYDSLAARYGYRPPPGVRVEVFPRHADFSVRTAGLVGLGALGVTFGRVVAMDSPSARDRGDFNWGSTLWHEIAHVFHLGLTGQRVPRWLTEGLAVREERRARPGWGHPPDPSFLQALKEGRILPVSRLGDGFVRPSYPGQVVHSYYEASLVVQRIEDEHGFDAILAMLHSFAKGDSQADVFHDVLGTDPAAFDRDFDAFLRRRFATPLASLGRDDGFEAELRTGARLLQQGRLDDAATHLRRAKTIFPAYAGPGNAYALLARVALQRGDTAAAARELARLDSLDERDYFARTQLASLRQAMGDDAGAAAALREAIFISPFDPALHERLAALDAANGDHRGAVRERRAVVALAPVDRAEALYQLALALLQAGDAAAARREVLHALEVAPNFQKAQALLLRLHAGDGGAP